MSSQTDPITIDDLAKLALVHDPQAHGNTIAWVVTRIDEEADTYTSAIWVASADGSNARQLTSGNHRDTNPRWSPDGSRIAFTSNRPPALTVPDEESDNDEADSDKKDKSKAPDKKKKDGDKGKKHPNQIWMIRLDGGEAQQVSNLKYGASDPAWKWDSSALTFSAQSNAEPGTAPMTNGDVADERIIRDLSYRFDGLGYRERYSHIWTLDLASGTHNQLTFG